MHPRLSPSSCIMPKKAAHIIYTRMSCITINSWSPKETYHCSSCIVRNCTPPFFNMKTTGVLMDLILPSLNIQANVSSIGCGLTKEASTWYLTRLWVGTSSASRGVWLQVFTMTSYMFSMEKLHCPLFPKLQNKNWYTNNSMV